MSLEWYVRAAGNLGPLALLRLQLAKRRTKRGAMAKASGRRLDHPVWFRAGSSDPMVFDQIFIEREYRCIDELRGLERIVDCGANVGYSSTYFLSRFPKAFVVAIEPDAGNYAMLLRNLAPYRGRFVAINAAIWSHPTTLRFDAATTGEGLEWGRTLAERSTGEGREVEAIDIGAVMTRMGWETVDLLKVDIEGAEEEVFARGYESWLGRVRNFVMEVHGDRPRGIVDAAVRGRGYRMSSAGELTVGLAPT